MAKFISFSRADKLAEALHRAGVVKDNPEDVSRIVIDLKAGEPAKIYVELYAETETIDVLINAGLELILDGSQENP